MKRWTALTLRLFHGLLLSSSVAWVASGFAASLPAAQSIHAATSSLRSHPSYNFSDPVGLGTLYQRASDQTDFAFVVEDDHHFQQRPWALSFPQYGFSQSRLELGTASGIHLASVSGITLYGLKKNQWFAPQVGIEPFSARLSWNTSSVRESFYEWFPMFSAGPQLQLGSCRFLNVMRGGAAVGNIGRSGLLPRMNRAYGAGSHLDCRGLALGADFTRMDGGIQPINLGTVDLAIHLRRSDLRFGIRLESLTFQGMAQNQERRAMLLFRTQPY